MCTGKSKKIYVVGNPVLEGLAFKLVERLKPEFPEIDFVPFDPIEDFQEDAIFAIDLAEGIDKVTLIEDFSSLGSGRYCTLHSFDFGLCLKLLRAAGRLKRAKIIAIPKGLSEDKAFDQLSRFLKRYRRKF